MPDEEPKKEKPTAGALLGTKAMRSTTSPISTARFLIFTMLFPPLALLVYIAPIVFHEGVPKLGFLFYLMGFAYVLALVPAWLAAAADWVLSAKPFYFVATMAVAAVMAHLIAWNLGDPLYLSEIISEH